MFNAADPIFIMVLKQIITHNIQNHKHVVIDLPPTGLVVFTGNNSNGKSVIGKVTHDMLADELRKPRTHNDLINWGSMWGEATYIRDDNVILTVHITREASGTYYKYEEPGKEPIIRYLSDKSYMPLVEKFGWHYDKETDVCLQIAAAEDALLFYGTSLKTNGKILTSALTDNKAQTVLDNFNETLKESRRYKEVNTQAVRTLASIANELRIYDLAPLEDMRNKLFRCYRNLKDIHLPKLPYIQAVPKVHYCVPYIPLLPDVKAVPKVRVCTPIMPKLPTLHYPRILTVSCILPDVIDIARELQALRERKCPTCGRGFDCNCG